jgi:hypothetical protein
MAYIQRVTVVVPQQCLSAIDVKLGSGTTWKAKMRLEGETRTEGFAKRDVFSVLGKPERSVLCCSFN